MSENQNNQTEEKPEEDISTPTRNTTQATRQPEQSKKASRAFIKYGLLSNLMLAAFSISDIILIKLIIWSAGNTFGVDDASAEYLSTVVQRSAFSGFAMYHMLYQIQGTTLENTIKSFLHKLNFNKRKSQQAIGLGIILSFIAIGIIAIKDGAVLRSASMAFLLVFILMSFSVGLFFAKLATYFFIKGIKTILNAPSK